jgi:DNA helicase-2/ATP-dependent DNA helicase PcrA
MILDDLNTVQRDAVKQKEGPIIIIAGAGSGKTRTLTYRIAYLISQGVNPFNIISLTFTNKAAKEMKDRIVDLVGIRAKGILMGTFHSVFARILRVEAEKIGYVSNFTIYDTYDSKKLITSIVKEMNLDKKNYKDSRVLNRISSAKCGLYSPIDYKNNEYQREEDRRANIGEVYRVYAAYQRRLKQAMAMDFDDILFNMNVLLRDFPQVKEKYQRRFQYILVDEYQDTNFAQYLIVKKLADYYKNICVVGDDAQSIYSFRGASIQNILSFTKDYPQASIYKLEQNYRSTKNIINAANSVIINNDHQIQKTIWTDNENGDKIIYKALLDNREEARWVSDKIKELHNEKGVALKDMAILYRVNSQSKSFEDDLRLKNIPYIVYCGTSFYEREEIKHCIAYLRLVVNNNDDEAFLRIVNYPARGIGDTTLDRLKIVRGDSNQSLFSVATKLSYDNPYQISNKAVKNLQDFCAMIQSFSVNIKEKNAFELGSEIIKRSGIISNLELLKDSSDKERLENIEELVNSMQSFVDNREEEIIDSLTGEEISIKEKTLDVFLQQVSLMSNTDTSNDENDDRIKLMTVHSAKGLEFNTVFVVGMEENLFPSSQSFATQDSVEEERRLFYVAITRAKTNLFLSSAKIRYKYNKDATFSETSRFIKEIDERYIDNKEEKKEKKHSFIDDNMQKEVHGYL